MNIESQLQVRLLLTAPERFKELRLFRRNIGSARLSNGSVVRFAVPGQCDLYGVLRGGRLVEIELKSAGKKIKPGSPQEAWKKWCDEWGVPHLVLTQLRDEHYDVTVDRWCVELRDFLKEKGLVL